MVNVKSAYDENSAFEVNTVQPHNATSFFRSMLAMAALDILLLFFILNPLSRPNAAPAYHRISSRAQQAAATDLAAKRSPLGSVAKPVSKTVTARGTYSARQSGFVTVAYRQ